MPCRLSDPLPDFIAPELALLVKRAPEGDAWLHEVKIDGYRTGAPIERGDVRMLTRAGNDGRARFKPIAAMLATLKTRAAYIDGEIAVVTPERISDFGAQQLSGSTLSLDRLARLFFRLRCAHHYRLDSFLGYSVFDTRNKFGKSAVLSVILLVRGCLGRKAHLLFAQNRTDQIIVPPMLRRMPYTLQANNRCHAKAKDRWIDSGDTWYVDQNGH